MVVQKETNGVWINRTYLAIITTILLGTLWVNANITAINAKIPEIDKNTGHLETHDARITELEKNYIALQRDFIAEIKALRLAIEQLMEENKKK